MEFRGSISIKKNLVSATTTLSPTGATQTINFDVTDKALVSLTLVPSTLAVTLTGGVTNQIYQLIVVQPSTARALTFTNLNTHNLRYEPKDNDTTVLFVFYDGTNYISVNGANTFTDFDNVKTDTIQFGSDPKITRKQYVIGDWDMEGTTNVSIAHGLSSAELLSVREVNLIIINDSSTVFRSYHTNGMQDINLDATNINLVRLDIGIYDDQDYNATSFNRGYVTLCYTPD
tara:strand:- start:3814 stop:4506 length:693 start_codon:yes stop_codon:yes gene_type:complete